MIRLRLLGSMGLIGADGRELRSILAQPKRFALLAVLAAQPGTFIRRDTLLALFWPELDDTHGRWALGQALRFLRTELGDAGPEVLISRGASDLGVNPAALWCDAAAFREHVDNGKFAEALELYHGDLLPAFFLDAVPAFEEWLERERARTRHIAADAARRLARECERETQMTRAVGYARRAVELSDDDERVVRELISMLDRMGDRAGALAAYDRLAQRMSSEFDVEASAETQALIARIRARAQSSAAAVPESASSPPLTADALATPTPPVRSPSADALPIPRRRWTTVASGLTIVLLLGIGLMAARERRPPDLTPDLLVVAPFEVLAPDLEPWREGLSDVLARDLDGAGTLRTVSPSVALKSFSGRSDASTATALARRLGARLAMYGVLQHSGRDSVRVSLAVIDASSGRNVAEVDLRDAVDRIDRLADSISTSVMRRLSAGNSRSAHGIGTRSLTGLKEYLQGSSWSRRYGMESARDSARIHFQRALELDSGFALAWSALADVESWPPPNLTLARKFAFRAAALNRGLGPRDSMKLLADSLALATGDYDPVAGLQDPALWSHLKRLYEVTDRLARENPRDAYLQVLYADVRFHMPLIAMGVTDHDVLSAFDRAIALDSTELASWRHAVPLSYFTVGREEGHRRLTAFATVIPDSVDLHGLELNLRLESAGAVSDQALRTMWDAAGLAAQRASGREWLGAVIFARDSGGVELRLRELMSGTSSSPLGASDNFWAGRLTYRGRLRGAAVIPQSRNSPAFAVLVKAGLVRADSVSVALGEWKPVPMPVQPCGWLMDWFAARSDTAAITNCLSHLRRSVSDTSFGWRGPMIRALNAFGDFYTYLARRDTAAAIRALDIGVDTLCPVALCAAWHLDRAAALAAVGRSQEALRIVRARLGPNEARPIYPMMQLQRARLAMRLGDTLTALNAYSLVADAWTGADPELQPFVAEAKRALASNSTRLRGVP